MKSSPPSGRSKRLWYLLLGLPPLAGLFPQLYASGGPELAGIPFFYWSQLAWTILTGAIVGVVYLATR